MPGLGSRAGLRCSRRSQASTCRPRVSSAEARSLRHTLVPLTWCSAQPSGRVTQQAFEHIAELLCVDLRRPVRSMPSTSTCTAPWWPSTSTMPTAKCFTACAPSSAPSTDRREPRLSRERLGTHDAQATALVAYQTYPHVDMAECGGRAARCLHDLLGKPPPIVAFEPLDFLVPLTSGRRSRSRCRTSPALAAQLERAPLLAVNVAPGFPAADVRGVRPERLRVRVGAGRGARAAFRLVDALREREAEFALELHPVSEACRIAQATTGATRPAARAGRHAGQPGAGGNADTTTLLKAWSQRACDACSPASTATRRPRRARTRQASVRGSTSNSADARGRPGRPRLPRGSTSWPSATAASSARARSTVVGDSTWARWRCCASTTFTSSSRAASSRRPIRPCFATSAPTPPISRCSR